MNPLRPTIEAMLEKDIDELEKMTIAEIEAYLEEALKICPIPKVSPVAKATDSLTKVNLGGDKLTPRSKMGKSLASGKPDMAQMMALYEKLKNGGKP